MKYCRWGEPGSEKPGVVVDGKIYDISSRVKDIDAAFLEKSAGDFRFEAGAYDEVPLDARLGCPVANPSKIVCIGLNYTDHAEETHAKVPEEPIIFMKATTSIIGPNDDVMLPRDSKKTDWEVELAIVIGKKASYVEEGEAMDYVAGYCLHNDVSEREFQLERGGTWDKGKGCDTFAPLGPWLVTRDELEDVHNLRLWLTLNGETMQDGNTKNLIFNVPYMVSYVSRFMTLLPGDIISTGTPAGVGLGMNPQVYLKDGDVMECGIDGLGKSKQKVVAFSKPG